MRIAVLGATGTVGRALLPLLAQEHDVLAVSRRRREESAGVRWARADATNGAAVARVLDGVEVAYYLVHSLGSPAFEQRDRAAAETVAREAGARTAVLNPIEGLTEEQAKAGADYFSLMRENLRALREALGCR